MLYRWFLENSANETFYMVLLKYPGWVGWSTSSTNTCSYQNMLLTCAK